MAPVNTSPSIPNSGAIIALSALRTPIVQGAGSPLMENLGNGPLLYALKASFNKKHGSNFNATNTFGSAGFRLAARTAIRDLMVAPWSVVMPLLETPQWLLR